MQNNVNIQNKRARFEYEILDKYIAGIVLKGTEIKSIRLGKASIAESFCEFNEKSAQISGTGCSKERIGGRVRNDIAVGMPAEPAFARPVQARDPQLGVFLAKGMHVYTGSYAGYGGLRGAAVLRAGSICHEGAFHRGCVLSFRSGRIPAQSGRVRALCTNRAGS